MSDIPKQENKAPVKLTPVWLDVPRSFYAELDEIAEECGLTPVQVIRQGIRLVRQKHRETEEARSKTADASARATVRKQAAKYISEERWKGVSPEERSEFARRIAQKRWEKAKKSGHKSVPNESKKD